VRSAVPLSVLLLLVSCAAPPPFDPVWFEGARAHHIERFPVPAFAQRLLEGFDAPGAKQVDELDRQLWILRSVSGDRVDTRLMLVQAGGEISGDLEAVPRRLHVGSADDQPLHLTSPRRVASVRLFDEEGHEIEHGISGIPVDFLCTGLFDACAVLAGKGDFDDRALSEVVGAAGRETVLRSIVSLYGLARVVRSNRSLFPLLRRVVDMPSVLSVLLHFGVDFRLDTPLQRAERWRTGLPEPLDLPAYRAPLRVTINGAPALRISVVAAEPRSPLTLSAGIVEFLVERPSDPSVRLEARLLAARRGDAVDCNPVAAEHR